MKLVCANSQYADNRATPTDPSQEDGLRNGHTVKRIPGLVQSSDCYLHYTSYSAMVRSQTCLSVQCLRSINLVASPALDFLIPVLFLLLFFLLFIQFWLGVFEDMCPYESSRGAQLYGGLCIPSTIVSSLQTGHPTSASAAAFPCLHPCTRPSEASEECEALVRRPRGGTGGARLPGWTGSGNEY